MFDPTIFDNLKVVFEGAVYDMDLGGIIEIVERMDRVELSSMSRSFEMAMKRAEGGLAEGSFSLMATVADLSAELMALPRQKPGCSLELMFVFRVGDADRDCAHAALLLEDIWGTDPQMSQHVIMEYGQQPMPMKSKLVLRFPAKLNESHIDDIPSLLDHMLLSLERLDKLLD
ncbi:hypothetical protein [Paenibacillus agricola]|uniref:Uncharacterized protein n=1 Tax=Paenibacillus agricola TaxID=2716264 RepID=A0ABX0J2V7_9BACL|nr:hypothetical protein [Paenibacillus agricola]NHN30697.1 hypothetical protein [Paenibacillus agricola]